LPWLLRMNNPLRVKVPELPEKDKNLLECARM